MKNKQNKPRRRRIDCLESPAAAAVMFRRARRRTRTIPQRFSLLLGQNPLFRLEHSLFAFKNSLFHRAGNFHKNLRWIMTFSPCCRP
jgi:hypothetical protein